MAKKKTKPDVEEFANRAYRKGSTYAKEQIKESLGHMVKIQIPDGYTKMAERKVR